jgi:membrane peptidoglycan carboxypeptidase
MATPRSRPRRRRARTVVLTAASVVVALIAATAVAAVVGVTSAPSTSLFKELSTYMDAGGALDGSTLYATDAGKQVPIAQFYSEDRDVVSSTQMSPLLRTAAVDTEDPRFFSDSGVDVIGTIRAALADVAHRSAVQGGSSITQQYIKNVLVQECETLNSTKAVTACYNRVAGDSPSRKVQEVRYALALTKKYTKTQILAGYLNIVGLGGNVYGAQAGSEYYFGVSAAQLSLPQAATLVAIWNNPSALRIDEPTSTTNGSPNGYALTKARRDYVLGRMHTNKSITKAQEDAAIATPVSPKITQSTEGCSAAATKYDAGYFCEYVRDEILADPAFGSTEAERAQALNTEGLQIHSTLDLALQRQGQQSLSAYVPSTMSGVAIGGSNVTVQPGTGKILSMVQNTTYTQSDSAPAGSTAVNYSADEGYGGSHGFPTGSTFKAFTLAEWLATGHSLYDEVSSSTHSFSFSQFTNSCKALGVGTWNVANADAAYGDYTVLNATAQSINTVFAEMGTQLDLCKIADLAKSMGIHTATGAALRELPSMILGVNELSPIDLASAYAGFANGGIVCTPVGISSVSTAAGSTIKPTGTSCTRGVSAAVAGTVDYALQSVLTSGTGVSANPWDSTPKFAKTGTTDSDVQNWLVASTTKYTNATWVGNVSGQVGLAYTPMLQGTTGYSAKFGVGKGMMTYLDAHYGGGALPTPDQTMIGTYGSTYGNGYSDTTPSSEATAPATTAPSEPAAPATTAPSEPASPVTTAPSAPSEPSAPAVPSAPATSGTDRTGTDTTG